MRKVRFVVVLLAILGITAVAGAQGFTEDFESYAAGSAMHGQGGWKGWDNVAGSGAPVSSKYAYSGSKSVEIIGTSDLVHEFAISGNRWVFSAMQYIPSGSTGSTYFILLNTYRDGGPDDWSVQSNMNMTSGVINLELGSGTATIVYDRWVELKCIINLDENTVDEYYNGELISTHQWDDNVHGTLQAVDLYGNGASSVWYDDVKVERYYIYKAQNPVPADGDNSATTPLLQWTAGDNANWHDVYFGTNPTPGTAEFKGRQTLGFNMYWHGPGFIPGTTYYWRIDEVEGDGVTIHTGDVWSFTAATLTAQNPNPADGAKWVATEADLSWSAGATGIKHDVYFGTDQTAVANGTGGTLKSSQQTTKTYEPGTLTPDTAYYWRVDEYDSGGTKYPGKVWSFTTIGPYAGVKAEYYNWSGAYPPARSDAFKTLVLARIDPAINFSWGGASPGAPVGTDTFAVRWVGVVEAQYSEPYIFTTRTDDGVRMWLDDVLIIDSWIEQGATFHPSSPIDLIAGQRYGVRVEYYENGGDAVAELYWQSSSTPRQIIPAGALQLPITAGNPNPPSGAVDVKHTPTLRWKAGEKALKHDVYFGTDAAAVANATTASAGIYRGQQNLAANSYVPTEVPLAWSSTYYWRIDEVNAADTWKGSTWSFTTANFIVVDDFEEYTDDIGSRIFQTWKDGSGYNEPAPGYPGNGTGSTVGYAQAPFAEQNTVHSGSQSMPLGYDNSGTGGKARYSETLREWISPQDWTIKNVKALTLYFYGAAANAAEQLYVAVEDNAGHVKVINYPDLEAVQIGAWHEWNIELTQVSAAGVNLAAVKKMYIGLGNRTSPKAGGTGRVFIDDIGVYPSRCIPSIGKPAADLNSDCVVDAADVDILANLWLDSSFQITPVNPGTANLVAHYTFDGNLNDSAGSNNGTATGLPTYGTGKSGQAIRLDGVDDYVDCGSGASLNITNAVTISAWIRLSASGIDQKIAGNQDNTTGGYKFGVFTNDKVEFEIRTSANAGTLNRTTAGGTVLTPGVWYHVAGAYSQGNYIRTYVNGVLDREMPTTAVLGTSTGTLKIGCEPFTTSGSLFNGLVDEVQIYKTALSAGQVAWLAGYTSVLSIPADLRQDNVINFKDFAVLADSWLEEILWP